MFSVFLFFIGFTSGCIVSLIALVAVTYYRKEIIHIVEKIPEKKEKGYLISYNESEEVMKDIIKENQSKGLITKLSDLWK